MIVTNGKSWRLYSTTADNKATNYYEINLEEAVEAPDQLIAIKYWWLFFRRQAFTGFLDDLLQQSADYAKGLGERLKDRTFTSIFPRFAEGFIHHMRAEKTDKTEKSGSFQDDLDAVFTATMTFLYRLMFLLYAESLSLLPVIEERGYGELSLRQLKKELAEADGTIEDEAPKRLKARYKDDSTALYQRLQRLFKAIDAGDAALNLPMYNGGLFSTATPEGRFLAEHAIPNRFLALGLDRLCRDVDDKTQALALIDYKSLGVRQLGSIYEGLLEFKLRIAAEPLVVVKEKGKEVYLPAKEAGGKRPVATLDKGDVYLENDKRERKATGSYYTPDYIVKYIVEHTVGPVLERKFEALTPRLREAQKLYRERKKLAEAKHEDPEKFWNNDGMRRLADDCLDVKVLDPAMGSGHFLVEAVDFISDRLIQFLNAWSDNPVWALLERTRQDILADMDRQHVSIDAERLTRVPLLKRSVLKRCIYGVDLNAMAVELAKVSLWLDAFTLGAPLSFLDHHLKHGNSLIGARVKEVREALEARPGQQLGLFSQSKFAGVMLATDLMRQVSYLSDNTAGQLQASQAAFRSARDHLAPYKRVLAVYTSRWFGNHPNVNKAGAFDPPLEFLQRPDVEAWLQDPASVTLPERDYMEVRRIGEIALQAAEEKRFFHWELEFPEVFFAPSRTGGQDVQLREDGGFDAVVGNPPYVRVRTLKEMSDSSIPYYESGHYQTAIHVWDIYLLIAERANSLLSSTGNAAFIMPVQTLHQPNCESLRFLLVKHSTIYEILDLAHLDVFSEALVKTCIIRFGPATRQPDTVLVRQPRTEELNRSEIIYVKYEDILNSPGHSFKPELIIGQALIRKIEKCSRPLGSYYYVTFGLRSSAKGIGKGGKDRLILRTSELPTAKRYMEGREIDRYNTDWAGNYIDYQPSEMYSPRDPKLFEVEKIVSQSMLSRARIIATFDPDLSYVEQSLVCVVPYEDLALQNALSLFYTLALMNSRLVSYFFETAIIDESLGVD